jgi:putative flippase GtrA
MAKKKVYMDSWKKDLSAALLVGVIAGPLSVIVLKNLGVNLPWYYLIVGFPILTVAGIVVGRILGKVIGVMYKFVKFGEVGGLNWLVDLGVINILVLVSGVASGWITVVYKAISFSVAVVNSYFWNKGWVFSDAQKQDQTKEAGKFLIASLIGLAFNAAIFTVIKFFGPTVYDGLTATQWISAATVVASLAAMIFNFVLYKIWVFKD